MSEKTRAVKRTGSTVKVGRSDPESPLICPASPEVTKPAGDGEYVVVKVDPFEHFFSDIVVTPLQTYIPKWINPNHITLSNVLIRITMLYFSWRQSEYPCPFSPNEYFLRALFVSFLFIFTEIIDDLDGCHARKTDQCSKLGEVLDHLVDAFGVPILG